METEARAAARLLGRRGGLRRARALPAARRREIARGAAAARWWDVRAARNLERILDNLRYVEIIRTMTGFRDPIPERASRVR